MRDKVNLEEKVALLESAFSPGIVGYLNDYKLAVVKVRGEFVWHKHDDTDDFFLVLGGRLTIQFATATSNWAQGRCSSSPVVSSTAPGPTRRRTCS